MDKGKRKEPFQFACVVCPQTFCLLKNLRLHLTRRHPERGILPCSVCDKVLYSQEDRDKHESTHWGSKPFVCEVCDKRFMKLLYLREHLEAKHSNKPRLKCDLCDKTFQDTKILKKHMGTHSEEKAFKCKYCPNAYKFKYYLSVHMRTHTGEKLINCKFCSETFLWSNELILHERRVHTGEKPEICEICKKKFFNKTTLRAHMKRHKNNNNKPVDCEKCGKTFSGLSYYKKHFENVHTTKMYACMRCDALFPWTKDSTPSGKKRPVRCEKCRRPPHTPAAKPETNCSYMVVVDSTKDKQNQMSVRVVPYKLISVVILYACKVCRVQFIVTQENMDCDGVLSRCKKCAEELVRNHSNIQTGRFTFPLVCHMCNKKSRSGLFVVDKTKSNDYFCLSCEKEMVECLRCEQSFHPVTKENLMCDICGLEHVSCTVCEESVELAGLQSHLHLHFGLFQSSIGEHSLLLKTLTS